MYAQPMSRLEDLFVGMASYKCKEKSSKILSEKEFVCFTILAPETCFHVTSSLHKACDSCNYPLLASVSLNQLFYTHINILLLSSYQPTLF